MHCVGAGGYEVRIALFEERKEEEKNLTQRHRRQEEEKRNGIDAESTECRRDHREEDPKSTGRSGCATVRGGLEGVAVGRKFH
jgi:hypothetical protein